MVLKYGFGLGGYLPKAAQIPFERKGWDPMLYALEAAMEATGRAQPNPVVGAALSQKGLVKEVGWTQPFGGVHAERHLFERYQGSREDSEVHVLLEPCAHQGKQPPCADYLGHQGIRKVTFGALDPNPLVYKKGLEKIRALGIKASLSDYSLECITWNLPFFHRQVKKRPLIVGKWAQTMTGLLADDTGKSQWITGKEARQYTHFLRQHLDAILVGAGTFLKDVPSLNVRDVENKTRDPLQLIFDPKGLLTYEKLCSLPEGYLSQANRVLIAPSFPKILEDNGWRFVEGDNLSVFDRPILNGRNPIDSILVEGGPKTLSFFQSQLRLDVMVQMISPKSTLGSKHHLGMGYHEPLSEKPSFKLLSHFPLGQDLLVEWIQESLWKELMLPLSVL